MKRPSCAKRETSAAMLSWSGRRSRACAIGGLEVLVAGDPLLQTTYSSVLLRPDEEAGRAWHEWLGSGPARAAIEGFRLNGTEVFWPLHVATEKQIGSQTRAEGRGHGFRDVLKTRRRHTKKNVRLVRRAQRGAFPDSCRPSVS